MKIKKLVYMLMVALLLLTACRKAEKKENAEVSSDGVENIEMEEQLDAVETSNGSDDKNNATESNSTTAEDSSDTQNPAAKPATEPEEKQVEKPVTNPAKNPSTSNTTPQKPSGGSDNQTTQEEDNTSFEPENDVATESQLKAEADAAASKYMNYYQEVLRLVNEIRAEVGVAPLTLNTEMCKAASMRAIEMDYHAQLSHTRPNGSSCFSVLDFYGINYSSAGENIAMGYSTPAAVVEGWRTSQGHYKNMISPDYTQMGVGYSNMKSNGNTPYWAQLFAR